MPALTAEGGQTTAEKENAPSANKVTDDVNEVTFGANKKPQNSLKTSTSSDSPNNRSNLDKSLSEQEREKFLNFAWKKVEELPQRPILPKKWIQNNFEDLHFEWQQSNGKKAQNITNQNQFVQWYDMMRRLGHLKGMKQKDGVQLVQRISGEWVEYEYLVEFWKLDYLKKCLNSK